MCQVSINLNTDCWGQGVQVQGAEGLRQRANLVHAGGLSVNLVGDGDQKTRRMLGV